jgi:hypothetical protein
VPFLRSAANANVPLMRATEGVLRDRYIVSSKWAVMASLVSLRNVIKRCVRGKQTIGLEQRAKTSELLLRWLACGPHRPRYNRSLEIVKFGFLGPTMSSSSAYRFGD